jgi:threonine/homoserine/homoserine lactone efflux protein
VEIFEKILSGLVLGLLADVIPGPIMTAAFTEALRNGFPKSLRVVFKSLVADWIIAIFLLALFTSINIDVKFFYAVSFVGAAVLIWLALQVWKIKQVGYEGEIFSFWKIFLLMAGNGVLWIFWITVCVPQAFLLREMIFGGQFIFFLIFETGWFSATVAMVFVFSRFRNFLMRKKLVSSVFKFFSLALFIFAIKLAVESIIYLFNVT